MWQTRLEWATVAWDALHELAAAHGSRKCNYGKRARASEREWRWWNGFRSPNVECRMGHGWVPSLSGNVAFCHCHRCATDKNEIRLPNNVKNISFVLVARRPNAKHEYYIFPVPTIWHLSRSRGNELRKRFSSYCHHSNCACTLFTGYTFLFHCLLYLVFVCFIFVFFCFFQHNINVAAVQLTTSKVNFISIDVAIFPILPYFAFAAM